MHQGPLPSHALRPCGLAVLRELRLLGCPVDWAGLQREVRAAGGGEQQQELLAWLQGVVMGVGQPGGEQEGEEVNGGAQELLD